MNYRVLESGHFTQHAEDADRQMDAGTIALRDVASAYNGFAKSWSMSGQSARNSPCASMRQAATPGWRRSA